jgi:methionyl-tRNA synthetase
MLNKLGGSLEILDNSPLKQTTVDTWTTYHKAMENYEIHKALQACVELMSIGNKHMNDEEPWRKTDDEKLIILSELAELLRHIALMLLPFIPAAAEEMLKQLNVSADYNTEWNVAENWSKVGSPNILFSPLI